MLRECSLSSLLYFILFALSSIYITFGSLPWVAAVFTGLKAAVLAIVLAAVMKIGKKSLKNNLLIILAFLSFLGTYFFKIPFPFLILTVGIIGIIGGEFFPGLFTSGKLAVKSSSSAESSPGTEALSTDKRTSSLRRNRLLAVSFFLLWSIPIVALRFIIPNQTFFNEALFFTKAAFLTFGGAYSLLGYIAQAGVEQYGWLTSIQMMDGLGLAETTPGPLIMVVQFVGFLAGWNNSGSWTPLVGAMLGSGIATYFTFLPSFLFIFVGAPYIEKLSSNSRMAHALSTITASVVGVVLNLGVWFGTHVLFLPDGFNWFSGVLAIVTFILMHFFKLGIIQIIVGAGCAGLLWHLAGI